MREDRTRRSRPAASWPAVLLPGALLVSVLFGSGGQPSDERHPVVDMTVTGTLGR